MGTEINTMVSMTKHPQKNLDESYYHFDHRFWLGQGFDRLLLACSNVAPVTFAGLRDINVLHTPNVKMPVHRLNVCNNLTY